MVSNSRGRNRGHPRGPLKPLDSGWAICAKKSVRRLTVITVLNTTSVVRSKLPLSIALPSTTALRKAANSKLDYALSIALAPKTSKNYSNAVKQFLKFTASIGLSESDSLPCSEDLLCLFLAQGIRRTGPGTAKGLVSGIRQWHIRRGLEWHGSQRVSLIKKALLQCWPKRGEMKTLRPPVTHEMMDALAKEWSNGSRVHACALAMALAAWNGQMRLGELMPEQEDIVDDSRLPARFEWSVSHSGGGASTIKLPWTKTTGFDGATVYLIKQPHPFDATSAMRRHLSASQLDDEHLLCAYRDHRGRTRIMDKVLFMELCNDVWEKAGIGRITGHSFRIGGTTSFLRAGVDPKVVKQMGRWKSDAFLVYWRGLEEIFSAHAGMIDWRRVK